MLHDPIEKFGSYEKNYTPKEKEEIAQFLKHDYHVPIQIAEMVYSGETETEYFGKVGKVMAALAFPMFMMFPVIRGLPIKSRVFSASLPAYYCYYWGSWYKEHLWWVKTYSAYQKYIVYHGKHPKIFI